MRGISRHIDLFLASMAVVSDNAHAVMPQDFSFCLHNRLSPGLLILTDMPLPEFRPLRGQSTLNHRAA